MPKNTHRGFTYTINNYTSEDIEQVKNLADQATYLICGKEVGANGTPHLQGYVYFKNQHSLIAITKKLRRAHIEIAKGTAKQNQTYCTKSNNILIEHGRIPQQGERTDIKGLTDKILKGLITPTEILVEDPMLYHQYGRTLDKIEDIKYSKTWRTQQTTCEWIYGTTGTGKSEYAFKDYHPDTHYKWETHNGWNDNYRQQATVIIDEFRGQMKMSELLTMIDKHPNYSVHRRGRTSIPFTSKHVIITSSLHPSEVYSNLASNDKLDQLLRRIKVTCLDPVMSFHAISDNDE